MLRLVVTAIALVCAPISLFAQTEPAALTAKTTAKKPARQPETATKETAAKATRPADGRACQIGVIPIAGNLFLVESFGLTTFTDSYVRVPVESWGLDELVVSRVRAAAPGMSVRRVPFLKEELAALSREKPFSLFYTSSMAIKEFAQSLAPRIPCERYVVVHRHGGNQREFGIGISKYYPGGKTFLFAMMYIRVYDGQSFRLIREAPALMTEDTYIERILHNFLGGPSRQLDSAMFPVRPVDAATNPVLRDGVREMLTASFDKTLPALLAP